MAEGRVLGAFQRKNLPSMLPFLEEILETVLLPTVLLRSSRRWRSPASPNTRRRAMVLVPFPASLPLREATLPEAFLDETREARLPGHHLYTVVFRGATQGLPPTAPVVAATGIVLRVNRSAFPSRYQ